ncbi:GET complex subunit GET1 KNAG_0D03290 [Huiozyma naganishii CBS 8797]|uniref:Guided entry of tail-anchored proteins 1 n=1 Tax=Huiozyma naganishii (strain ATCC MYA-139 / BCRC 22969 / CBS 8797 / KCTC 17520 / NBRC 10181 / NCYC 3082 / Yp74L-3) TaxID=1071383 RepID=J7R5F8_HUIN7|nr:hypothetical protein KNAG_0D03290 [Kazachstania naganishii CBS 8797]CCK70075.1 hypothetical protein KNAG_0D03290 [Kazachstania naganishii CBS 8797]
MNGVVAVTLLFVVLGKVFQFYPNVVDAICARIFGPANARAVRELRTSLAEYAALKEKNMGVSAQDEYTKWTLNNRKLDKLNKRIDSLKQEVRSANDGRASRFKHAKLVLLTVPFTLFKLWFGKHVVYTLRSPKYFPSLVRAVWDQGFLFYAMLPLQWLKGRSVAMGHVNVSLGVWCWALSSVLATVEFVVKTLWFTPAVPNPAKRNTSTSTSL